LHPHDTHLMIGTCVLIIIEVHSLVPEMKKTKAGVQITVEDVKRILEVGRLLLSVLAPSEIEMLARHLRNELPTHRAGDGTLKVESTED